MADLSAAEGKRITEEALTWRGTVYSLVGAQSRKGHGGDCSGTTNAIYKVAGFDYQYQRAPDFPAFAVRTGVFRKLLDAETIQDGDIFVWDDHMAIHSTFSTLVEAPFRTTPRVNRQGQPWTQLNDMWTATHLGGGPYKPAASKYFKEPKPDVYRFVKP